MSQPKTRPHEGDVQQFLESVEDPRRRADALAMAELMADVTGEAPRMWGPSIVGYGSYHYRYDSGREGDWMATGFSPRKQALTVYIMSGFDGEQDLMDQLGTFKTGKSCLYLRRLDDVDVPTLKQLIRRSVEFLRAKYPADTA